MTDPQLPDHLYNSKPKPHNCETDDCDALEETYEVWPEEGESE